MPIYDFKTCTRIGKKDISCKNIDFIIVEGLFCLYDEKIRILLDVSLFIDIPDEIRLKRRLTRDILERGANKNELIKYRGISSVVERSVCILLDSGPIAKLRRGRGFEPPILH